MVRPVADLRRLIGKDSEGGGVGVPVPQRTLSADTEKREVFSPG
jgi:hypothetical protein